MRRLRAVAAVLLLCAVAAELTGFAAYRLLTESWFTPAVARAGRDRAISLQRVVEAGENSATGVTTQIVPHPYIGFVYDPSYDVAGTLIIHGVPVSPWGFLDDKAPIRPRDPNEVIVAITGGSVAFWFSVQGVAEMLDELAQVPAFRGKKLIVIRTALGGTKQPQQLMTLSYLLSLGALFDVVVNIDGFNEVALAPAQLIPRGVFPFFPRDWADMLGATGDPVRARLIGEITYLRKERGDLAAFFSRGWLPWSPLAACVWTLRDRAVERRIARAQHALETAPDTSARGVTRFASLGPPRAYPTTDAMYDDLAGVWRESSRQMHRLAAANGIRYFHVLQPNQYVDGSKPISAAEAAIAVRADGPYAAHVRAGYPRLQALGQALSADGIAFYDLTDVFKSEPAPLYIDDCCHFSAEANGLLGRRIGQLMKAALSK